MHEVYIHFIDGASLRFKAREFNINVGRQTIPGRPKRFSYKDANGQEVPIYLQLEQVAAIILTSAEETSSSQ
jgi:hypothetical protein